MGGNPLRASELYALSQGVVCEGRFRCHWCGAACQGFWQHGEPPPVVGVRQKPLALVPSSPYVCAGCWCWRRTRVTVPFLSGGFKDGQAPAAFSWYVTERQAWAVRREDAKALYERLLDPPLRFALLLRTADGPANLLQFAAGNDLAEVHASTPLHFTLNNAAHAYTVYELSLALRKGPAGALPGVRALVELLGSYELPPLPQEAGEETDEEGKKKWGRPAGKAGGHVTKKLLRTSGGAAA